MAQPAISSSTPTQAATDVFVNISLEVVFDVALLESSVTTTSVSLTDLSTNTQVGFTVQTTSATTVVVTPTGILAEDTVYKLSFPGTDTALSSSYVIKDSGGEALATTRSITFRTGARSFVDDTSVDKEAGDLTLEGDLTLPANVKALGDFVISTMSPKNHEADVATTLHGGNDIRITFDNILSTGSFTSDMVDVDVFPLLDNETWLAESGAWGGSIPGHTVAVSGNTLTVTFNREVPNNLGIQIGIESNLVDADGTEYGPNDFLYSISTDRWPSIAGVNTIKREIKAAKSELTDEYIASTLLSNTVKFNAKFNISTAAEISKWNWVVNNTIVDILDDQELEKALVAGTRRQLGDFNVAVDPIIGKLSLKHARAKKAVEDAERALIGAGLIAKRYSHVGTDIQRTDRNWYGVNGRILEARFITHQPDLPAANSIFNRNAKIKPGDQYW